MEKREQLLGWLVLTSQGSQVQSLPRPPFPFVGVSQPPGNEPQMLFGQQRPLIDLPDLLLERTDRHAELAERQPVERGPAVWLQVDPLAHVEAALF